MTLDSQIKSFQDYARQSLQSGHPSQALALLTQARELDPSSSTTLMLQAIALSSLNQPALASETFSQALAQSPENPKLLYNYAVHLYSFGLRDEARAMVQRALEINPEHRASNELARKLDGNGSTLRAPSSAQAAIPRGGYDQATDLHTIPTLKRLATAWAFAGWTLAAASLVCFVLVLVQFFPAIGSSDFVIAFTSGAAFSWIQAIYVLSLVGTILFGVFDLLDRRGNFAWLIVFVLLPLICLAWLALALYLTNRRNA